MRYEFSAVTTETGRELFRAESELLAADFAARVNQSGGFKMSNATRPEYVAVRPVRVPGRKPRNRGKFAKFGAVAALALALASGLVAPASTDAKPGPRFRNPGTANAAVWVDGRFVQFDHVGLSALSAAGLVDCVWFEDGTAECSNGLGR